MPSKRINMPKNNKTWEEESVDDTRLRYQLHDIIVRGLVENSELSKEGFEELLNFIKQTLLQPSSTK